MNIDLALEKIYSLKQFHVKLGLDNITHLADHLGNPQNNLKAIHVAGSNGKGSTCSFLASILQELGYKVGLFTSPHFVRFNERIRINGKEISDNEIINFLERNKKYIDEYLPTFFEITTALAFEHFNCNEVDYAVIETGLGGRLDATNIIKPQATVITSISLEHSHILGNTLEKIALEKAGILKENVPIFLGILPEEAEAAILKRAKEKKCECYKLSDITKPEEEKYYLKLNNDNVEIKQSVLKGKHQLQNSALAINVINYLVKVDNHKIYEKGIDNIIVNTGIQGRYEKKENLGTVIFDAAHNLEGIKIFLNEFKKEFKNYSKCKLVFGAMKDKEIGKMLNLLNPYFSEINVTSTNYERAASADEISEIAKMNNINVGIDNKTEYTIQKIFNEKKNNCIVVLGSIYLLGEIKRRVSL